MNQASTLKITLESTNTHKGKQTLKAEKQFLSSYLHVKFDPWPSTHVPPLKHSDPFRASSLLHASTSSSQFLPAKPSAQKQAYLSMRSTQEPPFRQGLEAQSCERQENKMEQLRLATTGVVGVTT